MLAVLTGVGLVSVGPVAASAAPAGDDGTTQNVIVVLQNQHDDLAITKGKQSARVDANRTDQSGAIDKALRTAPRTFAGSTPSTRSPPP